MMGFSQIFLQKCVFSTAMQWHKKKLGTIRPNFEQKRRFLMALGPNACLGGFSCISLFHTRARTRPRWLASPSQGEAWLAWYVSYHVDADVVCHEHMVTCELVSSDARLFVEGRSLVCLPG